MVVVVNGCCYYQGKSFGLKLKLLRGYRLCFYLWLDPGGKRLQWFFSEGRRWSIRWQRQMSTGECPTFR